MDQSSKMDKDSHQKRMTDCVYFLASPLTCKKGIECEYRHCEVARLNPMECWYWLAGSCLNPTCAFRHPPLEGRAALHAEQPFHSNKSKVPCYFYFNGHCNKGNICSFLHGPDSSSSAPKPIKHISSSTEALIVENEVSMGKNTTSISKPTDTKSFPSETEQNVVSEFKPGNDIQCLSIDESRCDKAIKSGSIRPEEVVVHDVPRQFSRRNIEEHLNNMDSEEQWGSSPGFDVLVDEKSEEADYDEGLEDDLSRQSRQIHKCSLDYENRQIFDYDLICPDTDIVSEREVYDRYICLCTDHNVYDVGEVPASFRENICDPLFSRKSKWMQIEGENITRTSDLRDHLKRQREISSYPVIGSYRRCTSYPWTVRNQGRYESNNMVRQLSRRLASELEVGTVQSVGVNGIQSQQHTSFKEIWKREANWQFFPSRVSRKQLSRKRKSHHGFTAYRGSKSLDQIKEGIRKSVEYGHCKVTLADFRGPKPLSELLEEKRRLDGVRDCNSNTSKVHQAQGIQGWRF